MNLLVPIFWLVVGLLLLIKGGDWFVDGASGIARRFHLPEILIGATVVSIGTTLPEVMVSAGAAFKGVGDIAYGNAIGSIICNTALISAITIAKLMNADLNNSEFPNSSIITVKTGFDQGLTFEVQAAGMSIGLEWR